MGKDIVNPQLVSNTRILNPHKCGSITNRLKLHIISVIYESLQGVLSISK